MFRIDYSNPIIENDMKELHGSLPESKDLFDKSVYVSGANGMIASYIVGYLAWLNERFNAGISIYVGIRNTDKGVNRFGDLLDKDYMHVISQDVLTPLSDDLDIDYIIHAASLASPQYYGTNPVETMLPNLVGTNNLLDYSRKHDVKGFLFLSSGAVYGTVVGNDEMFEESQGVLDFLDLGNAYAESKRSGEALCVAYNKEYGVRTLISRVHHTYGPTVDIENDSRVYSEFIRNIIDRKDIELKSSGEALRAFCYITDTVSGLLKTLLCGEGGKAYNLGNPYEYISIYDLACKLTHQFSDRNIKVVCKAREDAGYRSCAAPFNAPVNIDKLVGLGWKPHVSLSDGFARTVSAIDFYEGCYEKD